MTANFAVFTYNYDCVYTDFIDDCNRGGCVCVAYSLRLNGEDIITYVNVKLLIIVMISRN